MAQPQDDAVKELPIHEWLAVIVLIGLLFAITLITLFAGDNAMPESNLAPHYVVAQEVEVFVEGAVEHPGPYRVKRNSLVQDVVTQAKPLPNANLKALKLDKKVRKGQIIKVKEIKKSTRKAKKT